MWERILMGIEDIQRMERGPGARIVTRLTLHPLRSRDAPDWNAKISSLTNYSDACTGAPECPLIGHRLICGTALSKPIRHIYPKGP